MPRYLQAILVCCEILWDEMEQLQKEVFRREVRLVLKEFNHLLFFGTTGEGHALDTARL